MSGVRMLDFLNDWWKFIQIYQYYSMAVTFFFTLQLQSNLGYLAMLGPAPISDLAGYESYA